MIYDVIIIGADSAGLTAGIYAGRKKLNTAIVTKRVHGQSLYAGKIENYPGFLSVSGIDLVAKIREQAEKFGAKIIEDQEIVSLEKSGEVFTVRSKDDQFSAKSVIIATGRRPRPLNVKGENEFMSKGLSVCTICDAPLFEGKTVAVIGGGNSAFDSAYDLLNYADKIFILQHRDKFVGDQAVYEKLKATSKVEFITNAETREIKGTKFVESLVYEDLKTNQVKELKVGGIFLNVGQIPNSSFAENFLTLNDRKEIIIDCKTNATSVRGVFAAGDVTDVKYKQVVVAAAEGAKALLSAHEYLRGEAYSEAEESY